MKFEMSYYSKVSPQYNEHCQLFYFYFIIILQEEEKNNEIPKKIYYI